MAKAKGPTTSIQNRHIYTRASYLYQAATYLATLSHHQDASPPLHGSASQSSLLNTSRHILSDMRSVTLKTQIRRAPTIKRSICKFCDTLMIEGRTCVSVVENASKGARKPWADVLVVRCGTCGHVKRFPVGDQRRKGKGKGKGNDTADVPRIEIGELAGEGEKEVQESL